LDLDCFAVGENWVRQEVEIRPAYAQAFRCIGSDCEDTCCQGWTVPVDLRTWEKYQAIPEGPLQVLVHASVTRNPRGSDGVEPTANVFAQIRMDDANQCPILSGDGLCRIQSAMGAGMLSDTCATYPRIKHSIGGREEQALALSCPEAARLVLLSPDLLSPDLLNSGDKNWVATNAVLCSTEDGDADAGKDAVGVALPADFWQIRSVVLSLVRNRVYPLWQRLFLLDLLCRRLDAIDGDEGQGSVADFLSGFVASVSTGQLRGNLEGLPFESSVQMDMVLRLAGMMLHKSNVRPRFVECVQNFTAGIGNGPGATLESLTRRYAQANERIFAPFLSRAPHILENFLINSILRCEFPYGKENLRDGGKPEMAREFAQLAAQFVLMRGLLIGVAGFHGAGFSAPHVVHTVQAASKHFEHHPEFLSMAHALLKESGMDGARGLAVLLRDPEFRDAGLDRASGGAKPATPAKSAPGLRDEIWASSPREVEVPIPTAGAKAH